MKCHWCLKSLVEWITIEGFDFCNERCEGNFYADSLQRETNGLIPLSLERIKNQNKGGNKDEKIIKKR